MSSLRTAKITFVGRLRQVRGSRSVKFTLLQMGCSLDLEYPNMQAGIEAQDQILQSVKAHKVPSDSLLNAIQEAMEQAKALSYLGGTDHPSMNVSAGTGDENEL